MFVTAPGSKGLMKRNCFDWSGTACQPIVSPSATVAIFSSSPRTMMVETPRVPQTVTTLSFSKGTVRRRVSAGTGSGERSAWAGDDKTATSRRTVPEILLIGTLPRSEEPRSPDPCDIQ